VFLVVDEVVVDGAVVVVGAVDVDVLVLVVENDVLVVALVVVLDVVVVMQLLWWPQSASAVGGSNGLELEARANATISPAARPSKPVPERSLCPKPRSRTAHSYKSVFGR
jgi:hypothetical protein